MAINYAVQAEVVDITVDTPRATDTFLVDTNVWYWLTYTRATLSANPPQPYQTSAYPKYTNAALGEGAQIFQSVLSLAELAHLIERTEREIYQAAIKTTVSAKKFRHNYPGNRKKVCAEVCAAYGQITSLANPLAITVDQQLSDRALRRLQTEQVDGYDLFILESMRQHDVVQTITDDGDFATVPDIRIFTANRNVIQAADAQGKLVKR